VNKITPDIIRSWKVAGRKISALTAYDFPTAKLLDESGIDLVLVGDSLGMTVLGYPDTTHVQIEDVIYHTRAVARGISSALLAADLPIYSCDTAGLAVQNAGRLISAGAQAVKLEGCQAWAKQIHAITAAGIPFLGTSGCCPSMSSKKGDTAEKAGPGRSVIS
jgi:3-methyl-2-oxobutanoate hydroxymethyltransferase